MDVSVEIHCEACGSANYSLPSGDGDDAPIRCNDCGADQGTFGELKAALVAQALAQSAEALRARPRTGLSGAEDGESPMRILSLPALALLLAIPASAQQPDVTAEDRHAHERMIVLDTHLDIPTRFDDGRWDFGAAPPLRRGRQPGRSAADGGGRARWRLLRHLHARRAN